MLSSSPSSADTARRAPHHAHAHGLPVRLVRASSSQGARAGRHCVPADHRPRGVADMRTEGVGEARRPPLDACARTAGPCTSLSPLPHRRCWVCQGQRRSSRRASSSALDAYSRRDAGPWLGLAQPHSLAALPARLQQPAGCATPLLVRLLRWRGLVRWWATAGQQRLISDMAIQAILAFGRQQALGPSHRARAARG
jgi:hypothetical protein